jgi:hypothetical protein
MLNMQTMISSGSVHTISINSNRLDGELPNSERLRYLIGLKAFHGANNLLRGVIPSSIRLLESLQELNLSWNNLSGEIPVEMYTLRELRVLRLDNNDRLGGVISSAIQNLTKMVFMNMSNCSFVGEVPYHALMGMNDLKVVDLKGNGFGPVGVFLPDSAKSLREEMGRRADEERKHAHHHHHSSRKEHPESHSSGGGRDEGHGGDDGHSGHHHHHQHHHHSDHKTHSDRIA